MPSVVTVRFLANVEILVGKKSVMLSLDDSKKQRVKDVIAEVTRLESKDLKSMVMDREGRSRCTVRIVLNGKLLLQDPLEAEVNDGDTVMIFPLIAGG